MGNNSDKQDMSEEPVSHMEFAGEVIESSKGIFTILTDTGQKIRAKPAGKLRLNKIMIMEGDRVIVTVSVYDPTNGIVKRRLP